MALSFQYDQVKLSLSEPDAQNVSSRITKRKGLITAIFFMVFTFNKSVPKVQF